MPPQLSLKAKEAAQPQVFAIRHNESTLQLVDHADRNRQRRSPLHRRKNADAYFFDRLKKEISWPLDLIKKISSYLGTFRALTYKCVRRTPALQPAVRFVISSDLSISRESKFSAQFFFVLKAFFQRTDQLLELNDSTGLKPKVSDNSLRALLSVRPRSCLSTDTSSPTTSTCG